METKQINYSNNCMSMQQVCKNRNFLRKNQNICNFEINFRKIKRWIDEFVMIDEAGFNKKFGAILEKMEDWDVYSEEHRRMHGKPDIIIDAPRLSPIVIESEFLPARDVISETCQRIGQKVKTKKVTVGIALRIPIEFKDYSKDEQLENEIKECNSFEFSVYTKSNNPSFTKKKIKIAENKSGFFNVFPNEGWLMGNITDIARMVKLLSYSMESVDKNVRIMNEETTAIASMINEFPDGIKEKISDLLIQPSDEQTWKMAALVIQNAFLFHDTLTGNHDICSLTELKENGKYQENKISEEWEKIMKIDYIPIFKIASEILKKINIQKQNTIIEAAVSTINKLDSEGSIRTGELYGQLFQKLIIDRGALATFYTLPESAIFMASLVVPRIDQTMFDEKNYTNLRIGDFACGTGALLSAIYSEIVSSTNLSEFDSKLRHSDFMGKILYGFDVLPLAAHLTVSSLAGIFPSIIFENTKIHYLPLGVKKDEKCFLGSFDLLSQNVEFSDTGTMTGGKGERKSNETRIKDHIFDLIVMNPPFTSNTKQSKKDNESAKPMFAAFKITKEQQTIMNKKLLGDYTDTCSDGNAGAGSYFAELAIRKIKEKGTISLILPAGLATSKSWKKVRERLSRDFIDIMLIGITSGNPALSSFSADTSISDCMLIATKKYGARNQNITIISLRNRPKDPVEAISVAKAIINTGDIVSLDMDVMDGKPIMVGKQIVANAFTQSIDDDWQFGNVNSAAILKVGKRMKKNELWMPGSPPDDFIPIDITNFDKIAERGYDSSSMTDERRGGKLFEISEREILDGHATLWKNDENTQTKLIVKPDRWLIPTQNKLKTLNKILSQKSNIFINQQIWYPTQRLIVAYTKKECIGGRTWPAIIISEKYHKAYSVWSNSTLGVYLYWYGSSRQKPGRGLIRKELGGKLLIYDFTKLNEDQLSKFNILFDKYSKKEFKELIKLNKDKVRKQMDKEMLKILDINVELTSLRNMLCKEKHFCGAKQKKKMKKKSSIKKND